MSRQKERRRRSGICESHVTDLQKMVDLIFDRIGHFVLAHEADILAFVLFRHRDVFAARLEFVRVLTPEILHVGHKVHLQAERFQVVRKDLGEIFVVLRVDALHVLVVHGLGLGVTG
jgi:hypothetical protein